MASDAQPNSKQRATIAHATESPYTTGNEGHSHVNQNGNGCNLCVICGDRACSHLYYGVSACHGCKCFFWRTVKTGAKYVCRYEGECKISTSGRNACRFCRFNRCLAVGMKIEAVRLEKRVSGGGSVSGSGNGGNTMRKPQKRKEPKELSSHESEFDDWDNRESAAKRARMDNRILINSLLLIDRNANEGAGHAATVAAEGPPVTLRQAFDNPRLLDKYRNVLRFDRKEPADSAMLAESARRLLTWTMDWTRLVANLEEALDNDDKTKLLRNCFAPLTLLELGAQSLNSPPTVLLLPGPGYIYFDQNKLPENCFLNKKIVSKILGSLRTRLLEVSLDEKELVMLKAIIVLNPDADGLAGTASGAVSALRARSHNALYQHIVDKRDAPRAAARLADILLLIPNLMLVAGELVEHIRMAHTFSAKSSVYDPLLYQLFGDIFEGGAPRQERGPYTTYEHKRDGVRRPGYSSSCSPVDDTCIDSS